jgi:hypothetical protein
MGLTSRFALLGDQKLQFSNKIRSKHHNSKRRGQKFVGQV